MESFLDGYLAAILRESAPVQSLGLPESVRRERIDRADVFAAVIEEPDVIQHAPVIHVNAFRPGCHGIGPALRTDSWRPEQDFLELRIEAKRDPDFAAFKFFHVVPLIVFAIPWNILFQRILLKRGRGVASQDSAGEMPDDFAVGVLDHHGHVAEAFGGE